MVSEPRYRSCNVCSITNTYQNQWPKPLQFLLRSLIIPSLQRRFYGKLPPLISLGKKFNFPREIASKQFGGQDTKGPRSFSRFLVRLGELSPRIVLKQISLLLAHLDSEVNYLIDSCIYFLDYYLSLILCVWR